MSEPNPKTFDHVTYLWNDEDAATLDPVERLVYRSNLLGRDQRVTQHGRRQHQQQTHYDRPADGTRRAGDVRQRFWRRSAHL